MINLMRHQKNMEKARAIEEGREVQDEPEEKDTSRYDLKLECHCQVSEQKTGCEMEAMVGVSVAALTIYDMCKSIDKGIKIENV